MELIVMRGMPGSGKSHWARDYKRGQPVRKKIVSADDFFTRDGKYEFSMAGLPAAHRQCKQDALQWFSMGGDTLIIDNTNTTIAEMAFYMELGDALLMPGNVRYVEMMTPLDICFARQTHGVPDRNMFNLYNQLCKSAGEIPSYWRGEKVVWHG